MWFLYGEFCRALILVWYLHGEYCRAHSGFIGAPNEERLSSFPEWYWYSEMSTFQIYLSVIWLVDWYMSKLTIFPGLLSKKRQHDSCNYPIKNWKSCNNPVNFTKIPCKSPVIIKNVSCNPVKWSKNVAGRHALWHGRRQTFRVGGAQNEKGT